MKTLHLIIIFVPLTFGLLKTANAQTQSGNGICTGGPGMCQTSLTPVVSIVIDIIIIAAVLGCCFMIFRRLKE